MQEYRPTYIKTFWRANDTHSVELDFISEFYTLVTLRSLK